MGLIKVCLKKSHTFFVYSRYQTGLVTRESVTRRTLEKPKKKLTCMQQKLQQVGLPQDKFKGSKEYLLLVKVC